MAKQLVYTSAPKGLWPGASGYCTVLCTQGLDRSLADFLERLSVYRICDNAGNGSLPHTQDNYDALQRMNPSNLAFVKFHYRQHDQAVLLKTCLAGFDYSDRLRKLSHFLVLGGHDKTPAGPAWLLSQPNLLLGNWGAQPTMLEDEKTLPQGSLAPRPCHTWQKCAGDAGWAGELAKTAFGGQDEAAYVIYQRGMDVLSLVVEATSLLPEDKRWEATFATNYVEFPSTVKCRWRFVPSDSPDARNAARRPGGKCIDLTSQLSPPTSPEADAARRGETIQPVDTPASFKLPTQPAPVPATAAAPTLTPDLQQPDFLDAGAADVAPAPSPPGVFQLSKGDDPQPPVLPATSSPAPAQVSAGSAVPAPPVVTASPVVRKTTPATASPTTRQPSSQSSKTGGGTQRLLYAAIGAAAALVVVLAVTAAVVISNRGDDDDDDKTAQNGEQDKVKDKEPDKDKGPPPVPVADKDKDKDKDKEKDKDGGPKDGNQHVENHDALAAAADRAADRETLKNFVENLGFETSADPGGDTVWAMQDLFAGERKTLSKFKLKRPRTLQLQLSIQPHGQLSLAEQPSDNPKKQSWQLNHDGQHYATFEFSSDRKPPHQGAMGDLTNGELLIRWESSFRGAEQNKKDAFLDDLFRNRLVLAFACTSLWDVPREQPPPPREFQFLTPLATQTVKASLKQHFAHSSVAALAPKFAGNSEAVKWLERRIHGESPAIVPVSTRFAGNWEDHHELPFAEVRRERDDDSPNWRLSLVCERAKQDGNEGVSLERLKQELARENPPPEFRRALIERLVNAPRADIDFDVLPELYMDVGGTKILVATANDVGAKLSWEIKPAAAPEVVEPARNEPSKNENDPAHWPKEVVEFFRGIGVDADTTDDQYKGTIFLPKLQEHVGKDRRVELFKAGTDWLNHAKLELSINPPDGNLEGFAMSIAPSKDFEATWFWNKRVDNEDRVQAAFQIDENAFYFFLNPEYFGDPSSDFQGFAELAADNLLNVSITADGKVYTAQYMLATKSN